MKIENNYNKTVKKEDLDLGLNMKLKQWNGWQLNMEVNSFYY